MTRDTNFADWLKGLQWDGKPRLMTWLHKTVHPRIRPTSCRYHHYLRLVGRSIVLAHVARALQPGCKYDHSIVLLGPQGSGKSQLIRTLIGDAHFDDGPHDNVSRPGLHAYEIADFTEWSEAELPALKAFMTAQTDRYRLPYQAPVRVPREFVIWSTTNRDALPHSMGQGRRIWPVYIQRADIAWLRQNRAQVFAEAVHMHRLGARVTPSAEQIEAYIQPEAARYVRQAVPV